MFEGLVGDAGRPSHVFVAAVGAASNQTCSDTVNNSQQQSTTVNNSQQQSTTVNTNSVRALVPAAHCYWVCLLAIMIMITIGLVVTGKNQKRNITPLYALCVCVCVCVHARTHCGWYITNASTINKQTNYQYSNTVYNSEVHHWPLVYKFTVTYIEAFHRYLNNQ